MNRDEKILDLRDAFLWESRLLNEKTEVCRKTIIDVYGSSVCFRELLGFREIDNLDDPAFHEAYDLYETIFTLPEERESFEGFRVAMELNACKELIECFGSFKEQWLLVDTPEGELIGGINFSVFSMPEKILRKFRCRASVHINYIFVKAEYRSLGIASLLLEKMEKIAVRWLSDVGIPEGDVKIFCEQNAPELMTSEAYFTDCIHARIDQCDRLLWWNKKGYSRLRFNYEQPALSENGEPCSGLTLNICQLPETRFPSGITLEHLMRFFTISVLKNKVEGNEGVFERLQALELHPFILTEGDSRYYKNLRELFYSPEVLQREPLVKLY